MKITFLFLTLTTFNRLKLSDSIKTGFLFITSLVTSGYFISQILQNKQKQAQEKEKENNILTIIKTIEESRIPDTEKMAVLEKLYELKKI